MFRSVALSLSLLGGLAFSAPNSPEVRVPIHVATEKGVPAAGLARENFRLFEDKKEQTITDLTLDERPVSLAVLVDRSGSMQNTLPVIARAVGGLVQSLGPKDEALLIEFGNVAQVTIPFGGDANRFVETIAKTRSLGLTHLMDAVDLAVSELKKARNPRRIIVIFSDGGDNGGHRTEDDIHKALVESDVQVFAVSLFRLRFRELTPEEAAGPQATNSLARLTGGRLYASDSPDSVGELARQVARQLHMQYVLCYSPAHPPADGKVHHIKVKFTPPPGMPKMDTSYRQSYRAH